MSSILLISSPGAGKGVISKYLNEKYNYVHVSMGNLLREKAKIDKNIDNVLKQGGFVDNNIVYNLLENIIKKNKNANFVFEGFPRMLDQKQKFEEILEKYDIILDKVIYVEIKKEIALKRITGRLICSKCNNIYNKYFDDIKDDKCNICSSKLLKRNDDKVSTYNTRYEAFIIKTIPLINYYKEKGILYIVSNNNDILSTYNQIDKIMEKEMKK